MPLVPALATMLLAQLLDLVTFVTMVRRLGPEAELNPVVLGLLSHGGIGEVAFAKLALILLVGSVVVVLRSRHDRGLRRASALLLGCAIVAGIVGGWTNAITLGPL